MSDTAVVCGATINGPKVGKNVVLWRKWCKNKTKHPSGRCRFHRLEGTARHYANMKE